MTLAGENDTGLRSATVHEASAVFGALPSGIKPLSSDMYLAAAVFPVCVRPVAASGCIARCTRRAAEKYWSSRPTWPRVRLPG